PLCVEKCVAGVSGQLWEILGLGPEIRCRDFVKAGSPEASTHSPGPVFHAESFFEGPGARRGPLDAETREKTSVLIFSMRWRSGGRSCQRPDLVREANLALGGGRDVHGDDDAVCQQLCDHIPPGKRAELVESVRRFAAGDDAALRFPPTLSNLERKLVHREAEAHGLHHESSGAGAKRRIQVSRRAGDSKRRRADRGAGACPVSGDRKHGSRGRGLATGPVSMGDRGLPPPSE
ncbi:unnamed protein product, partial [Prorocentrum cordatum]